MSTSSDWAGELGGNWAKLADRQDALLSRFEAAGLEALGDVAGRRVLDLGCGPGQSSFALAARGARTTGLDISPDLIAVARARAEAQGAEVDFVLADAAEARFEAPFDALFSRFGAMFFDEPVPAWTNLRAALAPGAPMVVIAWRGVSANPWVAVPLAAARGLLPDQPPPAPGAPGPFGWADPGFFAPMLEAAGWREVAWTEHDVPLAFGEGGDDPAASAAEGMKVGHPAAARINGIEDETARDKAWSLVTEALRPHVSDGRVRLSGGVWIVTAAA